MSSYTVFISTRKFYNFSNSLPHLAEGGVTEWLSGVPAELNNNRD